MRNFYNLLLLILSASLNACISYEPRILTPAITFSPEQISLTNQTSGSDLVDFGLELSLNESDSLFNIESLPGVRVRSLSANGPAASAGIQVGDVILKVDGLETNHPDAITVLMQTEKSSLLYTMEVQRGTTVFQTELTARKRSATSEPVELYRIDPVATRAGYRTEVVNIENRGPVAAARVVEFFDQSPLPQAGINEGDLVLALEGTEINSAQDLINRLNNEIQVGNRTSMTVYRENSVDEVSLRLWSPGRRISKLTLGPLVNYQSSLETDSTQLSILDLWLFAFYSYQRSDSEKTHSILGLLRFSSDVGELTEE